MIFEKIKRSVREQRLEENARAEVAKQAAQIEYLAIMGGYEEILDEEESEVSEDE